MENISCEFSLSRVSLCTNKNYLPISFGVSIIAHSIYRETLKIHRKRPICQKICQIYQKISSLHLIRNHMPKHVHCRQCRWNRRNKKQKTNSRTIQNKEIVRQILSLRCDWLLLQIWNNRDFCKMIYYSNYTSIN